MVSYRLHSEGAIPSEVTCGGTVAVNTIARLRSPVYIRGPSLCVYVCVCVCDVEFIVPATATASKWNLQMNFRTEISERRMQNISERNK